MENIPEIIIVSDSESDVEVENADDTKNTGIENSNRSNSSVFGEREKLPIDSIYVTESDDKGEKCKKFNELPQHEEEAGVDKDNMNTNDQDMNISGDNDNILCKGKDTVINNSSNDNSNDIVLVEPPITESIVISSDDEKSTIPEVGFYIHPRLIKTFDFEYSRTTSRPGPKSRTRKKLEIQDMYFQILNAGVNPKNGHRLSRYLQKQPCVSPKTKINMASKSGVKSNPTINIESDDDNCPRSSTQSIFLDTDHGTASTSSNSATVTCFSGDTSVSGFLSSDLKSSANIISPCNATSTATSIEHESMDVNTDCIVKTETEKENSIDTNSDCVGEVVKSEYELPPVTENGTANNTSPSEGTFTHANSE